jgi:hypothetical protein
MFHQEKQARSERLEMRSMGVLRNALFVFNYKWAARKRVRHMEVTGLQQCPPEKQLIIQNS